MVKSAIKRAQNYANAKRTTPYVKCPRCGRKTRNYIRCRWCGDFTKEEIEMVTQQRVNIIQAERIT